MSKLVEGVWDCPYCGQKGIGGLSKHCPTCGHPQDNDTKFYLGEIKYIEEEVAKDYGQGADWICEYCGNMNRVHYKFCSGCGAPKEDSKHNYFDRKQKEINTLPEQVERSGVSFAKIFGVLAILIALVTFLAMPKSVSTEVTGQSWSRVACIETMQTFDESDWTVPEGAQVYDQKQEISGYVQVVDHYEVRTRQVAEQVYDGEDTHTEYIDNGDGTFTEETYTTPRYRTEYHTEEYNEPIYRDEPVFNTKYYYLIDRWATIRTVETSGNDGKPVWGDIVLADGEREGDKIEVYVLSFKDKKGREYTANIPLEAWQKYKVGDSAKLKAKGTQVYSVDGVDVIQDM